MKKLDVDKLQCFTRHKKSLIGITHVLLIPPGEWVKSLKKKKSNKKQPNSLSNSCSQSFPTATS